MTRFDPITPEQVEICSDGSLTYGQLAKILESYGLSIQYVLHDPGRKFQNTFYADYDNALYRNLYLSKDYFEGGGHVDLEHFSQAAKNGNPFLRDKEWDTLYMMTIPLPMAIYDFQKRMRDIEPEKVFEVWYGIYKRIDYSNSMWTAETLDYVFTNAPAIQKPESGENGYVTLYRGMGKLSQPPETAISWTTHPGNALWFANHTGRGTHLVIADVATEDVVAYYPGFQYENEVIVRAGAVRNIRYEDMFPADEDTFVKLTVPALLDYQRFGQQAKKFGYQNESLLSTDHGITHILRVLLLTLVYVYNSGEKLTAADRDILIYFALLHDVGRTSDAKDDNHGNASSDMIRTKNLRIRGLILTAREHIIAHLIIQYHSREDDEGIEAIQSHPGFTKKDKDRAVMLYRICKDMDGLDRVRFNGLDYRMLRTEFARRLPLFAGCLLKEDMLTALGK